MITRLAMLLSLLAAARSISAIEPSIDLNSSASIAAPSVWTQADIALWAATNSAAANLLDSERQSVQSAVDRDDRSQCAQAAMVQAVLRDLACHERRRSAAQALTIANQLAGLQKQELLLTDASQTLEQLIRFADKATELDISDGDRSELTKQRLQVSDQIAQSRGAIAKLQITLSQLVARSLAETQTAVIAEPSDEPEISDQLDANIAMAKSRRCDLQAIDSVCRHLSSDTLPLAKDLIGSIRPGLGLAIAMSSRKPLLSALHRDDRSNAELCKRREQCAQLRNERERQIELEVHFALIDLQTASERTEIAHQQLNLVDEAVKKVTHAIELEKSKPGSDLLVKLERLRVEGDLVQRQVELRELKIKLMEVTGTLPVQ